MLLGKLFTGTAKLFSYPVSIKSYIIPKPYIFENLERIECVLRLSKKNSETFFFPVNVFIEHDPFNSLNPRLIKNNITEIINESGNKAFKDFFNFHESNIDILIEKIKNDSKIKLSYYNIHLYYILRDI